MSFPLFEGRCDLGFNSTNGSQNFEDSTTTKNNEYVYVLFFFMYNTYRFFNECSCIIELIKWVKAKG